MYIKLKNLGRFRHPFGLSLEPKGVYLNVGKVTKFFPVEQMLALRRRWVGGRVDFGIISLHFNGFVGVFR